MEEVQAFKGFSATEHQVISTHYDTVLPMLQRIFGEIPVLWTTFPCGFFRPPVYHCDFDDGSASISTVEFISPWGAVHKAARLNEHDAKWLVRERGAIEFGSWTPQPDDPQKVAFGRIHLAPSGRAGLTLLKDGARRIQAALANAGAGGIPVYDGMATLMVWIPLAGGLAYPDVYAWCKEFCVKLANDVPDIFTVAHLRAERGDRISLAAHSNGVGQMAPLPYTLVGAPDFPVHWPLAWEDVDDIGTISISAEHFATALARQPDLFAKSLLTLGEQSLPQSAGATLRTVLTIADAVPAVNLVPLPPHGYISAAAITILSDGRTRTVDELLIDASAAKLLPADLPRKYLYVALHEYVVRVQGVGGIPEFVQIDAEHFRINRPADEWPAIALPAAADWIGDTARNDIIAKIRATAVGGDPTAFEITICNAFAALGFQAQHVGGNGQPDGIVDAPLGVAGYRVIVECKTAQPGAPVENPRPEEPAGFRDRDGGQYALVIGPQFSNDRSLEDELQKHGTALWTIDDLIIALTQAIGPDEITPAFGAGRARQVIDDIVWERTHGRPKHVAFIADLIARSCWKAQLRSGPKISVANRPRLTRDVLMLLVEEALGDVGVQSGATVVEFNEALVLCEASKRIRRVDGPVESWIASFPPSVVLQSASTT